MKKGPNARNKAQAAFVLPMLLRRVQCLPEGDWQYEVKWDGYRMQAVKFGGKVRLFSRNGADYTTRFAEVAQAVARLNLPHSTLTANLSP